jgi:hypothetical protein
VSDTADALVEHYLGRLEAELAHLPPSRREELVEQIADHIARARAELPTQNEAEIRSLLGRIGDPTVIADEAEERRPEPMRRETRWLEVCALVLLLVGGIVVPVVGWLVGVVLLWVSDAWTAREKLVGTLVVPGGLLPALALPIFATDVESCSGGVDPRTQSVVDQTCTGGHSAGAQALVIAVWIALAITPLLTTIFLARRLRRSGTSRTDRRVFAASRTSL